MLNLLIIFFFSVKWQALRCAKIFNFHFLTKKGDVDEVRWRNWKGKFEICQLKATTIKANKATVAAGLSVYYLHHYQANIFHVYNWYQGGIVNHIKYCVHEHNQQKKRVQQSHWGFSSHEKLFYECFSHIVCILSYLYLMITLVVVFTCKNKMIKKTDNNNHHMLSWH